MLFLSGNHSRFTDPLPASASWESERDGATNVHSLQHFQVGVIGSYFSRPGSGWVIPASRLLFSEDGTRMASVMSTTVVAASVVTSVVSAVVASAMAAVEGPAGWVTATSWPDANPAAAIASALAGWEGSGVSSLPVE